MFESKQNKTPLISVVVLFAICAFGGHASSQTSDVRGRNNPYSPSPSAGSKQNGPQQVAVNIKGAEIPISKVNSDFERRTAVTQIKSKPAATAETRPASPADIYKVGVGDVLFINLKNTANASGYYTVRPNGTIDFPLAGDNVVVATQTTAEIEDSLAAAITLYPDARLEVKIREFGSHKILVSGMAERIGERSIQREAIPLYVIRADSLVTSEATKALIRRSDLSKVETFDLHDPKTDEVLIYPGNSVEFTAEGKTSRLVTTGFYYIAGDINTAGKREFVAGITLCQAILASGGAKGNPRKATIRRKGDKGTLNVAEHNLRAIKDGKTPDPVLSSGDMIEISN